MKKHVIGFNVVNFSHQQEVRGAVAGGSSHICNYSFLIAAFGHSVLLI